MTLGIFEPGVDIFNNPRVALRKAYEAKLITSWSDDGRHYTVDIPKVGTKKLKNHEVGEFIADRFLQVKDPIDETAKKKTKEDKEEDTPVEAPLDYDNLTIPELKEIFRQRDISGYSTMDKADLIKRLEEDDAGVTPKD